MPTIDLNTLLEINAVLFGIVYILLAASHTRWAWPAAFVSSSLYVYIFLIDNLPMQASLNLYFMGMAIYGWHHWKRKPNDPDKSDIQSMSNHEHSWFLGIGITLSLVIGFIISQLNYSQSPFLDAATSLFAIINTWLMLHHRLESWLYWMAIDAANLWLFFTTEHYASMLLFTAYLILSMYGYIQWKQQMQTNQQKNGSDSSSEANQLHPIHSKKKETYDKHL